MHFPELPGIPGSLRFLLESSVQAAVLVPIVVLVQWLGRRVLTPAWRHALWWVVLGRLLLPVSPSSDWSLFNWVPATMERRVETAAWWRVSEGSGAASPRSGREVASFDAESVRDASTDVSWASQATESAANVPADAGVVFASSPTPGAGVAAEAKPSPFGANGLGWWMLWGAGVGWAGLRSWHRGSVLKRRLRERMQPAGVELSAMVDACRARMGIRRPVRVLCGDAVRSPAVWGLWRPRILLPSEVVATSSAEALRWIVLHELAHVRRGDLWVQEGIRWARALHWFNPVLLWAFRRMRTDREMATDALVLGIAGEGESRAYGLTIVGMLERFAPGIAAEGAVGILEDNASLERRIRAIAGFRRPSRWAGLAAVPWVLLAATAWTGARSVDEAGTPTANPPTTSPTPVERAASGVGGEAPGAEGVGRTTTNAVPVLGDVPVLGRLYRWDAAEKAGGSNAVPVLSDIPWIGRLIRSPEEAAGPKADDFRSRPGVRDLIRARLENIRVPEVRFPGVPLRDVVRQLRDWARTETPDGGGVNFFMNPYLVNPAERVLEIDPTTGERVVKPVPEPAALEDVVVRIDPALKNLRLIDVLKALVASAAEPLAFTIEEYAVVLHHKPAHPALVTRVFRVDPVVLTRSIGEVVGVPAPGASKPGWIPSPSTNVQEVVRSFFAAAGVSLEPPRAVFFNNRLGLLMVRASLEEIEIVEQAVEVLNAARPEEKAGASPASGSVASSGGSAAIAARLEEYAAELTRLARLFAEGKEGTAEFLEVQARTRSLHDRLEFGPISAPPAMAAVEPRELPIEIVLLEPGTWRMNGEVLSGSDREERLRRWARDGRYRPVVVLADPELPWAEVVDAMGFAKAAGFTHVSLGKRTGSPTPVFQVPSLVPWRPMSELPAKSREGSWPILVAFEADWDLQSNVNRKAVLDAPTLQAVFRTTGTELYRIDCTRPDGYAEILKSTYGVTNVPAYVVYHPTRKTWTPVASPLTEASVSRLLRPESP